MEQAAEFLRAGGQPTETDAPDRGRIVRHHGHRDLHLGAVPALIAQLSGAPTQQTGNDTFDHGAAVARRAGQLHLVGRAGALQASGGQDLLDDLRGRGGRERVDGARNPHGEDAPGVQCLAQFGVVERQIAREGVNGGHERGGDLRQRRLDFGDQGEHVAAITGIAHRQMSGEHEAGGGLPDKARFAPKLGGTVTLAFADRSDGGIVGVDDFAAGQRLAVGEPPRLGHDLLMGGKGHGQPGVPARSLRGRQRDGALELRLGGLRQRSHRRARREQVRFGLPHQTHKDFPLPPALPPKAPHNLGELKVKRLGLRLQGRALCATLGRNLRNDLEDFFLLCTRSRHH